MNIVIDRNIPLLQQSIKSTGEVLSINGREISRELLKSTKSRALVVRSITKVNKVLLDSTDIQFVGTATSGTDHVDIEYLNQMDISFVSAKGSNANSVAEYVIYSILRYAEAEKLLLNKLSIGIIGFGCIGKIVARYSYLLGLKVLVNDPPLFEQNYVFPNYFEYASIESICSECDIVTNHVPLTQEDNHPTVNLLNRERIALLKKNSLFIHTSRGSVADESALLDRLRKREVKAVVDVWANEPLLNKELAKYCFMATPHIAGYSYDGKLKGALIMAESLNKVLGLEIDYSLIKNELNDAIKKFEPNPNYTLLLDVLEKNREFKEDYLNFLKLLLIDDSLEFASQFDRLRKEYPIRRECLATSRFA